MNVCHSFRGPNGAPRAPLCRPKHQGHLPGLCSAQGGVAGHEQRGAEQRKSPLWRCRWGRRRPDSPLWCGCCSSLTPVLGAAALGAAWGSSLGFVPRGGVAGLEQRGVEQRESPRGRCTWGQSEARCAPLVRLLLLSDPGFWCSGTRKHLGHLPGLCSTHGGAAGHEQRGMEQHESPRGKPRAGPVVGQMRPSGAAAAPL